ncbi:MAG: helix-turn-helix transcriptional regulator [Chitinophagaceae bacterium]|nr:helix-turn-helix transcriptional regulator [Chitinophagaceae bacterium]
MDFLLPDTAQPQSQEHLPVHLIRYAVTGAQCRYKKFSEGEYITQVILGNDYSVWSHHFFIRKKIVMHAVTSENIIALHYMMTGNVMAVLHDFGEMNMQEGCYHLLYMPGQVLHDVSFSAGHYHTVHINFHPVHLDVIARQYPMFEPMLSWAAAGIKTCQQHPSAIITAQIRDLVSHVLHNNMKPAERILFVESTIRNLLRLYIQDVAGKEDKQPVPDAQAKLIREVEEYIMNHLDLSLTVDMIARHFAISRSWLQLVSSNVRREGVHQVVRRKRMEAAARLLLETDYPVSKIVAMTSDMTFAAFSATFHAYWGIAPLQFRKNRGRKQ